jgi:hypothetical protein
MPSASVLLIGLALSTPNFSQLPPATVADVVAGAVACFDAVSSKNVELSRLTQGDWVELLDSKGEPETPGGHVFRRANGSGQIVVAGQECSLVAPVKSFEEVKAALLQLDDAIEPDAIEEDSKGVVLMKGSKFVLFHVGNPTTKTPAAVRIDVKYSENR